MRWQRGHTSPDVIDRRGAGVGGAGAGVLIQLLFIVLRSRFGWAGVVIVLLLAGGYYAWMNFGAGSRVVGAERTAGAQRAPNQAVEFVSFVLDDVQENWQRSFAERGSQYRRAKLVLFTDQTSTSCGFGSAASGPFYCPSDERAYIDLGFFAELERRFGAPGDFAQAYVIAHEIGHHVQNQLGTSEKVHRASRREREGAGGLSVRLELQADCYAGIWAHSTQRRDLLEAGDVDEALGAASAIGDDRLQRRSGGVVHPESWSHGSAEQRSRWFKRGLDQGTLEACDAFRAATL